MNYLKPPGVFCPIITAFLAVALPHATAQEAPERAANSASPSEPSTDTVVKLDQFQVDESKDLGYNSKDTVGAGRINLPLNELAQDVTVFNEKFMQDTGAMELYEAAKYSAGFTAAAAPDGGLWTLRGVSTQVDFTDGFPAGHYISSAGGNWFDDSSVYDRVELIKGPSSILYGQGAAGGVVNRISKRPLTYPQTIFTAVFGSGEDTARGVDLVRFGLDTTGPINSTLGYRLIGMDQKGIEWNGNKKDQLTFRPVLAWRPNDSTTVNFGFTFEHAERSINAPNMWAGPAGTGLFATFLPKNENYLSERDQVQDQRTRDFDLDITHQLPEMNHNQIETRLFVRFLDVSSFSPLYTNNSAINSGNPQYFDANGKLLGNITTLSPFDPNWATFDVARLVQVRDAHVKWTMTNFDFVDRISFSDRFALRAMVVCGLSYETAYTLTTNYTAPDAIIHRSALFRQVVVNPTSLWTNPTVSTNNNSDAITGYTSPVLTFEGWGKQFIVTAGARYDWNRNTVNNYLKTPTAVTETANQQWTKRFGAVFKPNWGKGASAYLEHGESFTFQSGLDANTGLPIPNLLALSNEAGLRVDALGGRLQLSGAYFDEHVANNGVNSGLRNPANNQSITIYENTHDRGTEFSAWYQVSKNWSLVGSFQNVKSVTATGLWQRAVPQGSSFTFWNKYNFHSGALKGWGIGGGYVWTAHRALDGNDTWHLPAFGQADAVLSYQQQRWGAQINLLNVLNYSGPTTGTNNIFVYRDLPRRVQLTLRYSL